MRLREKPQLRRKPTVHRPDLGGQPLDVRSAYAHTRAAAFSSAIPAASSATRDEPALSYSNRRWPLKGAQEQAAPQKTGPQRAREAQARLRSCDKAMMSYDPATKKVTLKPRRQLRWEATYLSDHSKRGEWR
jgi:hypothetical protein